MPNIGMVYHNFPHNLSSCFKSGVFFPIVLLLSLFLDRKKGNNIKWDFFFYTFKGFDTVLEFKVLS